MNTSFNRHGPRRIPFLCTALLVTALLGTPSRAPAQVDLTRIAFSGDIRVRSELDARTAGQGPDHATLLRTRLGARVHVDSQVRVFIQLSDSRIFGEETSTLTDGSADQLDLHQGYLDWMPHPKLRIRVGRQELAFADERLIGPVGWVNVNRSFDGLRTTLSAGDWTVDAFAAVLDEQAAVLPTGLDPRANNDDENDRSLYGVWATTGIVDLFAVIDRNATDDTISDIDRYTFGGYIRQTADRANLMGMLAVQLGNQMGASGSRQDIRAFMASARMGYTFSGNLPVSALIQADILSGDATPDDGTFRAFNTLYATNHPFYGFMDLFLNFPRQTGFLGLLDIFGSVVLRPPAWSLRADLHHFSLPKALPNGTHRVGLELDLTATRQLSPALTVGLGYSAFNPSADADGPPLSLGDELLHWAYVQGLVGF